MRHASTGLLLVALSSAVPAQDLATELLSRVDDYGGYSDVWGYRDPVSGREIAILETVTGTSFVETTSPRNPVELQFIPRATSNWADARTYQNYAYIVTEGGGGMQIVDLSDLDNIVLVKSVSSSFDRAHNVCIDVGLGVLMATSSNNGMPILSLADPINPVEVANYNIRTVHDAHSRNGLVHLAELGGGGLYRLMDITNLPTLNVLGSTPTPFNAAHNAWPSADDTFSVVTDEQPGGHFAFYDVSDPNNPTQMSAYVNNPNAIIHNAFIQGDIAHASYYTEGYVAVDISDPLNPTKRGQFDTDPDIGPFTDGAWGCYPFQPSGVIYISDQQAGLFLLALQPLVQHSPVADTLDYLGPYVVTATMTARLETGPLQGAELSYSVDGGQTYTKVPMTTTGNPDEYSASIPGQIPGTVVHYHLEATDRLTTVRAPLDTGDHVFRIGNVTRHYFNDFDGPTSEGWSHGATAGSDDWTRDPATGKSGDPFGAFSGNYAWGNDAGQNLEDGAYPASTTSFLRSPSVDLSLVTGARLRFQRSLNVEDAVADQATIDVNGVEVWRNLSGTDTLEAANWTTFDLDISSLADGVASTQVQFNLMSDSTGNHGGWNLDDFEIYSVDGCLPAQGYGTGYPGSGGFVPFLSASGGLPHIGNGSFQLDMTGLLGGAFGFLILGDGRSSFVYRDATILVDWSGFTLWMGGVASGAGAGNGIITKPLAIPDDPTLEGLSVYAQLLMADPGATKGVATSNGLAFVLCSQ